jgi:hypothetical protein
MQNGEFRLICLSRLLSDLSAAPLPESQGPGVSISLFGNSSRLNPLTLAGWQAAPQARFYGLQTAYTAPR